MYLQRAVTLLTLPLAFMIFGGCQDQVHPPFASDADGGATKAVVINSGVGAPNVSPGAVNPPGNNPSDTGAAMEQPADPSPTGSALSPTSDTSSPNATASATTANSNISAADATDPGATTTSEPFSTTLATLDTAGGSPSLGDDTPTAGMTTDVGTEFNTAFETEASSSLARDGGALDGAVDSEPL